MNTPDPTDKPPVQPPLADAIGSELPTLDEFETCHRVLGWLRNEFVQANPTWVEPTMSIRVAIAGCIKVAKAQNDKAEPLPPDGERGRH